LFYARIPGIKPRQHAAPSTGWLFAENLHRRFSGRRLFFLLLIFAEAIHPVFLTLRHMFSLFGQNPITLLIINLQ